MAKAYIFPKKSTNPNDPDWTSEIPIWMNFYAADYSTFVGNRTRNHIYSNPFLKISIPYPLQAATSNTQQYMSGKYPDIEGLFIKEDYKLKEQEMENSYTQGLGIMSYDHTETVLSPGARRFHRFEIQLVAKNEDQSDNINDIALAFQSNMYPTTFTESVLNMGHPPLWHIFASGTLTDYDALYWDGEPLVSVLQSVDINRSPIQNTPFMTTNKKPLAVNIRLTFLELEPAMANSNGLLSRSERFDQFARSQGL